MPAAEPDPKSKAAGRRGRREPTAPDNAVVAQARSGTLFPPAALVVGVTLLAFLPVLRNGFIDWDDPTAISQNPLLHPPTVEKLQRYWTAPSLGHEFYVPLNYTAYWVLAVVSRGAGAAATTPVQPWPFHAASWLSHAAAAVLVLLILHRLTGRRWAAAAGAALFALHPVQVEPVAWASSLYSPLSGALALASIWQYLKFSDARYGPSSTAGGADSRAAGLPVPGQTNAWIHYAAAILAFVMALLTKPTTVVVPGILFAIEWALRGRRLGDVVVPLGALMLAALPIMQLARTAEQSSIAFAPSPPWRALIALDALAFYLYKLVLPISLSPDYGRSPHWLLAQTLVYSTWVVPVVLLAVAWHVRLKTRWPLACVLVFGAALLPALGLVPFDFQRYSTTADRYLYLAMLAPALALACLLSGRLKAAPLVAAGVVVGLAALATLSHVQTYRWRDSQTLFRYTLTVNPRSLAAHLVLGSLYAARGQDEQALAEFDQALRANPGDAAVLGNVGHIYLRQGRFEEAAAAYREALIFGGGHPALNINLGAALAQLGRTEEALAALNIAVDAAPGSADAHVNLANVLLVKQQWQEARRHYEIALRLNPQSAPAKQGLARLNAAGR